MNRSKPIRRVSVVVVALSLLGSATACSGGGGEPVAANPTPAPAPATVPAPLPSTTTTEAPAPPSWALTGEPLTDAAGAARPAVVAKIDNSPDARPHAGINQADLVYEVLVEGITRFAAVYHSTPADPVGPVRSARSTDIDLLGNLHRPLLVWSGGNPTVTAQVQQAQAEGLLVDVSHSVGVAHYWRSSERVAPHNLYTNVSAIRDNFAPPESTGPGPLLLYRAAGEPLAAGDPVSGAFIEFGPGNVVEYVWDGPRSCWRRYQVDQDHPRAESAFVDAQGQQVCPPNVVVQLATYGTSAADVNSPQAYTVGEGEAVVLTDGRMVRGRWSRPAREAALALTTAEGAPVGLTRGRTWVAVPRVGSQVAPLAPETAAELLTYAR